MAFKSHLKLSKAHVRFLHWPKFPLGARETLGGSPESFQLPGEDRYYSERPESVPEKFPESA